MSASPSSCEEDLLLEEKGSQDGEGAPSLVEEEEEHAGDAGEEEPEADIECIETAHNVNKSVTL